MAAAAFRTVVARMAADPEFAARVRSDAGPALAEFDLTDDERSLLARLESDTAPPAANLGQRISKSSLFFGGSGAGTAAPAGTQHAAAEEAVQVTSEGGEPVVTIHETAAHAMAASGQGLGDPTSGGAQLGAGHGLAADLQTEHDIDRQMAELRIERDLLDARIVQESLGGGGDAGLPGAGEMLHGGAGGGRPPGPAIPSPGPPRRRP